MFTKKHALILFLSLQVIFSFAGQNQDEELPAETRQTLALLFEASRECEGMKKLEAQFSPNYKNATTNNSAVTREFRRDIALSKPDDRIVKQLGIDPKIFHQLNLK